MFLPVQTNSQTILFISLVSDTWYNNIVYFFVPIIFVGMYCSKLTSLNISHVSVTPRSLKMLTQKCSALKVLVIKNISECVIVH